MEKVIIKKRSRKQEIKTQSYGNQNHATKQVSRRNGLSRSFKCRMEWFEQEEVAIEETIG